MTESTKGLLGDAQLAMMKSEAVIINAARGGVLDEAALLRRLQEKRLAGAALDVFAREPLPASHPLLDHPRVITTPHVGFLSDRTDAEYVRRQADAVVSWRANGRPNRAVNEVRTCACLL